MLLYYNEISYVPICNSRQVAEGNLSDFIDCVKYFVDRGFEGVVLTETFLQENITGDVSISEMLTSLAKTKRDYFFSIMRRPFHDEYLLTDENAHIIDSNPAFVDQTPAFLVGKNPYGLACSFYRNSMSISFNSHDYWANTTIRLSLENNTRTEPCLNISHLNQIDAHSDFIENIFPSELTLSKHTIAEKKRLNTINGDHHGKKLLTQLATRLSNCGYVDYIVHSLPYSPTQTDPIMEIYPNGMIDIVLVDSAPGYGLTVQTTGKNIYETRRIAEIIRTEYFS